MNGNPPLTLLDRFVAGASAYRRGLVLVIHVGSFVVSNYVAFLLRFDGHIPAAVASTWLSGLPLVVAVRAVTFAPFRLYEGLWRYVSIGDLRNIIAAVSISSVGTYILQLILSSTYPVSILIIDSIVLVCLCSAVRLVRRVHRELGGSISGRRLLIYGAGDAGEMIVREIQRTRSSYLPLGFVDDDRTKVGLTIHGVPVLGSRDDLATIMRRHQPDEILIAIPRGDAVVFRSIIRALEPYRVPIKTLPQLREVHDAKVAVAHIRDLGVDDLLARAPVGLDPRPIRALIEGRRVLVTGAGGSIGAELCRQISQYRPSTLVLLDRYENSLHDIATQLRDRGTILGLRAVIGDVTDENRVNDVLRLHRPEIVFHAAAHKHVPLMEDNPGEAVKNNIRGTRILAEAAESHGVSRFVFISTDKAVNPSSVMGCTKRLAEFIIRAQSIGSGTAFSIVRFGNVLGSNGSVVPRFMEQIRRGGPVTITHPDVRRFFMLIPEAVQLVLHAASRADNGAVYVLEMGEQVKVIDIARDLIRLAGLVPEKDIRFEFTGLRPGEKICEELVGPDEAAVGTAVDKVVRLRSAGCVPEDFQSQVSRIESAAGEGRTEDVLALLVGLVPNFDAAAGFAEKRSEPIDSRTECGDRPADSCPNCHSAQFHRSRARSIRERAWKGLTAKRLFRCDECGWRGWLVPLDHTDGVPPDVKALPELARLDAAIPPLDASSRNSFLPRNLN